MARALLVAALAMSSASCTPGTPAGASRGVAARSPHVDLPASFPTSHASPASQGGALEEVEARAPATRGGTFVLPFRVHVAPSDASVPVLSRFPARLSRSCVTASAARPGALRSYTVRIEGTFVAPSYALRAQFDGHTSRSLVLAKSGHTEIALETLSNEWSVLTPGLHEIIVFARDRRGIVPQGPDGALAFQRCRFEIAEDGSVSVPRGLPEPPVLFSPEGTLHGAASDPALLQVAAGTGSEFPELRIRRPDGGEELHELRSERFATSPHALFDVSGLQNGDYTLTFVLPATDESVSPRAAGAHEHGLSVNRERAGTE